MVEVEQLFGGSNKVDHWVQGNKLPHDIERDLVTIHHPNMDRAYAGAVYLYKLLGSENHTRMPKIKFSTVMYVCYSSMMVLKNREAGA